MDMLHKFRELVAWVALGAVALVLLSAFVDIAYLNDSWPTDAGPALSLVARSIASKFAPVVGLLVAVLATWFVAYWREPSPKASLISVVGLCLAGGAALLYVVFTLIGWGGDDSNGLRIFSSLLTLLANLAALGIIAGLFYITWKHVSPAPAAAHPGQHQLGQQQYGQPGAAQPGAAPGGPVAQQPNWQTNEASGGAWHRADAAAAGAGANSWGVPGQQAQGWQPSASTQPSAAEPQQQWGQPAPQQPASQHWNQQQQPGQYQPGQQQPGQQQQPTQQPGQQQQPAQQQPAQNQWGQPDSGWAPVNEPQVPAADDGDEGTVLRPNPGQQWRPEDDQRH